ncbi:MAG: Hsp70 family protein [Pseudomonadota bacterium]
MEPARFAVGIDLGTTNCTLAWAALDDDGAGPEVLEIPQLVASGEVAAQLQLPSFLYLPVEAELGGKAMALPWDAERPLAVGAYARDRGSQVPGRVIASAKSWLCHGGVDRHGAILPWGAVDDVALMSPVAAAAHYLQHLREAWDQVHPDAALASQDLVVTVPASFDAVARGLTEEAVQQAGLGEHFTLLEEPQSAFYAWLAAQGPAWRDQVHVGDLILVCDIGGGTTDFSLIAVTEAKGSLELQRLAVGDHILLGGDNMDLALAYSLKAELEQQGKTIDDWQLAAMTHGCRTAKEALLQDPGREGYPVVVPSRGRKLIGGTLSTELSRARLTEILVEGFFPEVTSDARPLAPRRSGLTTLGLPYASDAAVTRHLAAFLGRQIDAGAGHGTGTFRHPTAVLFNGGVTKAEPLCQRIVQVLDRWLQADGAGTVRVLAGAQPDLAVARGAAYYAGVRRGRGVRIRGGTARAYYVGIERAELAVPGIPPRFDAICVAPFGMEEGSEAELPIELGLVVGESAAFRFFASSTRRGDQIASQARPEGDDVEELASVEAMLEGEAGRAVPVRLHSRVTEVGTLELAAVETVSGRRHRLEFNIRVE